MFNRILAAWRDFRDTIRSIDAKLTRLGALVDGATDARSKQPMWDLRMGHAELTAMYLERLDLMTALAHPRFASPLRLERYGHKVFSQFDEDGIISEIFRRIGATSRTFVEIAAGDGRENCTAALLAQGWNGLWVECDSANVKTIRTDRAAQISSGQLKLSDTLITPDNVNDIVTASSVGDDVDLLVIDIDGNDYHVLEALKLRPRVICTEYYWGYPPPMRWQAPRADGFVQWMGQPVGASLQSWEDLLTPRGYSLVGSSIVGVNCFFVRSDLVEDKFDAPFTAYNHYNSCRFWYPTRAVLSSVWNGPADGKPPPL